MLNDFEDASLDLIEVDGLYRTDCIRASVRKLKPGGLLLVDDFERWPSRDSVPIPDNWLLIDESSNGVKRTCIWQRAEGQPPTRGLSLWRVGRTHRD